MKKKFQIPLFDSLEVDGLVLKILSRNRFGLSAGKIRQDLPPSQRISKGQLAARLNDLLPGGQVHAWHPPAGKGVKPAAPIYGIEPLEALVATFGWQAWFSAFRQMKPAAVIETEEGKKILLQNLEQEARIESMALFKQIEDETRATAGEKAKEILAIAVDKCAQEFVMESTVSVVDLPSEEMKGRIIGREGRNIRAFERATGIDVIVDDTPEAVILSGFDPIRRAVAKEALQRLITDGRIHPARIEEIVQKVEQEVDAVAVRPHPYEFYLYYDI